MSGVRCTGTELALQQCQRHSPVHCPTGGGRFSAGVTCTTREYPGGPILLVGRRSAQSSGWHRGVWGPPAMFLLCQMPRTW